MEDGTVHHQGIGANLDAVWAGMQVHPLVKVSTLPQMDVVRKAQADTRLDGRGALHVQDETIKQAAQGNTNHGGNPTETQG
jgi:hypothetical protein